MNKISVVVPVFNEISILPLVVDNHEFIKKKYDVEFIYVDNYSSDGSYEFLNKLDWCRLERCNGSVGLIRNFGAEIASGKWILFIDSDCTITNLGMDKAISLTKNLENVVVGGGIYLPKRYTWVEKYWLLDLDGKGTRPNRLIGACILTEKKVFFDVGGFPVDITSGEDSALHEKLVHKNIEVRLDHEISVTHHGNAKTLPRLFSRIAWHSENHLLDLKNSIKDLMFIYCFSWFLLLILSIVVFFSGISQIFYSALFILILMPMFLTLRRIFRVNKSVIRVGIKGLFQCYLLDNIYILAKVHGSILGLIYQGKKSFRS